MLVTSMSLMNDSSPVLASTNWLLSCDEETSSLISEGEIKKRFFLVSQS